VIDQADALMDVPISIELHGLASRQPVTITATQTLQSNSRWRSQATFLTDEEGNVAVARQAPLWGSYEGVAAMGLIWSAERVRPGRLSPPEGWVMQPSFIHIEAVGTDGKRAEVTITRRTAGPGVTRQTIRTAGLVGVLFLPPDEGPILRFSSCTAAVGALDETKGAMLASHGYAAFNLAYFAQPGLPRALVNIPLEYFENAIRWMRAQPWLRDGFLAV